MPRREMADIYNKRNYTTKRLRDDQSEAWGQRWPEVGHTHTLGTQLLDYLKLQPCERRQGNPGRDFLAQGSGN